MQNEDVVLIVTVIAMAGAVAGGGLGARLARAPVWKGALTAAVAALVQLTIAMLLEIDFAIVNALLYLVAVGLIGGRWGMRLTVRQLAHVVLGSFLVAVAAAFAFILLAVRPPAG